MDPLFNSAFAAKTYDLICKMDDDSAEMFTRLFAYDTLMEDIANNRRTVDRHISEINKALAQTVSASPTALSLARLVSKDWDTPFEQSRHQIQPRDHEGKWTKTTITISRDKQKRGKEKRPSFFHADAEGDFNLTSALTRAGDNVSQFSDMWNRSGDNDNSTNAATYRRIQAGSELVGSYGGAKTKMATQAGGWAGQFGPEAEKVVGPHMRRAAYRYRGTERTPDTALLQQVRDTSIAHARNHGIKLPELFASPSLRTEATRNAAVQYFDTEKKLPTKRLSELQQKSGKIPPSEGVIINADGKVITQAIGYMDDHYLPFNLRNLKGLQGGSYVRTRSSGGLTTEDIYTGLVSGARSATVVSRSGVFTMYFDEDFRGTRRYNDKAAQMVSRYGKILDAVKSQQVTSRPLDAMERATIRDEVETEMKGYADRPDIEAEVKRRQLEAKLNPQLTKDELLEIEHKALVAAKGNKQKEKIYYSDMMDHAMESKLANTYKLDGEGYAVALDALKEQFPYYIADVKHIHRRSGDEASPGKSSEIDSGYVKPKYIRPEGAQEGYYDSSVIGESKQGAKTHSGKISADRLNYANWPNNPENRRPKAETATTEGSEGVNPLAIPVKPKTKAQQVAEIQEKANQGLKEDKALKDYADHYAPYGGEGSFPAIDRYKTMSDEERSLQLREPAFRAAVLKDLEDMHPAVNKQDHAAGNAGLARKAIFENAQSGDRRQFNREDRRLGISPIKPYHFGDEYPAAKPKDFYTKQLSIIAGRAKIPEALDMDDATLRNEAEYSGIIADAARKKIQDPNYDTGNALHQAAMRIGSGEDATKRLSIAVSTLGKDDPAALQAVADWSTLRAEAYERIRSIKAVADQYIGHLTDEAKQLGDSKAADVIASTAQTAGEVAETATKGKLKVMSWDEKVRFIRNAATMLEEHENTNTDHLDRINSVHNLAEAVKSKDRARIDAAMDDLTETDHGMFKQLLDG